MLNKINATLVLPQTTLCLDFWKAVINNVVIEYLNTEFGNYINRYILSRRYITYRTIGYASNVNRENISPTIPTFYDHNRLGVLGTIKALQSVSEQSRARLYKTTKFKEKPQLIIIG